MTQHLQLSIRLTYLNQTHLNFEEIRPAAKNIVSIRGNHFLRRENITISNSENKDVHHQFSRGKSAKILLKAFFDFPGREFIFCPVKDQRKVVFFSTF